MAATSNGTQEVDFWDILERDSCLRYRGADPEFVSLTANTPEAVWIADTMTRRWWNCESICGCNQNTRVEGEDRDGQTFLVEDCKDRFIEKVSKLEFDERERQWVTGLLTENYLEFGSSQYWDTNLCLRALYKAVWKAEIASGLRGTVHHAESELERINRQRVGAEADRRRAQLTLGLPED
jgi:hypothetical protein